MLAFAPFVAFAVIDRLVGAEPGLLAGALVSLGLLVLDMVRPGRSLKLLEIGTFVLFAGLALYGFVGGATWSVIAVRLWVDAGLLAIVLFSLAIGRPFTIQYAQEQVAPELWTSPEFIRINYVVTAAWAMAFAVMVVAELGLLFVPDLPPRIGIIAIILALVGAIKFTGWYPKHATAKRTI